VPPATVATLEVKVYPVTSVALTVTPVAKSNPEISGMPSLKFVVAAGDYENQVTYTATASF